MIKLFKNTRKLFLGLLIVLATVILVRYGKNIKDISQDKKYVYPDLNMKGSE